MCVKFMLHFRDWEQLAQAHGNGSFVKSGSIPHPPLQLDTTGIAPLFNQRGTYCIFKICQLFLMPGLSPGLQHV